MVLVAVLVIMVMMSVAVCDIRGATCISDAIIYKGSHKKDGKSSVLGVIWPFIKVKQWVKIVLASLTKDFPIFL